MQLEAHRIEVWFYWIACKRTMNARPRKPRFLSKVRNIVKPGGRANGVTDSAISDFSSARFMQSAAACRGLDCGRVAGLTDFLDMYSPTKRPAFLPT
jgi:hypothetical protein